MTKDVVERLRECANGVGSFKSDQGDFGLCDDAADEIERLRARLLEANALFSGLLDNESLAEHVRASVIEQMQDNRRTLVDG